jgi:hypothetical protein
MDYCDLPHFKSFQDYLPPETIIQGDTILTQADDMDEDRDARTHAEEDETLNQFSGSELDSSPESEVSHGK